MEHGKLVMDARRLFAQTPVVKLGDHFKKLSNFQKRFRTVPHMLELDHLTVSGDVWFGRNITLRGTVIIVANEGSRIDLPDGSILENSACPILPDVETYLLTPICAAQSLCRATCRSSTTRRRSSFSTLDTTSPARFSPRVCRYGQFARCRFAYPLTHPPSLPP